MNINWTSSTNHKYVTHVLLTDGWHEVYDRSFSVGFDDTLWRNFEELFGPEANPKESDLSFSFWTGENGEGICGPLTSVLAVRTDDGDSTEVCEQTQ